jgi:hypothetical protein
VFNFQLNFCRPRGKRWEFGDVGLLDTEPDTTTAQEQVEVLPEKFYPIDGRERSVEHPGVGLLDGGTSELQGSH